MVNHNYDNSYKYDRESEESKMKPQFIERQFHTTIKSYPYDWHRLLLLQQANMSFNQIKKGQYKQSQKFTVGDWL